MIAFSGDASQKLVQITATGQQHEEMRELVARAINTWQDAPDWVQKLSDELNGLTPR